MAADESGAFQPMHVGLGQVTKKQWLTLFAALAGWMFDGFEMGVFPLVAKPALKELLADSNAETIRQWNAVLIVSFLFGAALGGLVFGWLGDRIGRIHAMTLSVLTYALLTGVCAFADSAWHLVVLRFLAAVGMGGEWALGVALVMESWPSSLRPLLSGLFGLAANLGYAVVAGLALFLQPEGYWRYLLAACALPALLTFFIRSFVPESEQWAQAVADGPKPRIHDIFVKGIRSRSLLGASAGAVALLATWGAVQLTQIWVTDLSNDTRASAFVQLCSASFACIGSLMAPILLQNYSRRSGYFILCLLAFIASESLFLLTTGYNFGFFFAVACVGATTASFYGWLPLYLPELFPTRVRAAGQGFCYNAGRCLAALGVLATTFLIDVQGRYPVASSIVCLIYLVGLVLAWFLPETRGEELPG